MRETYNTDGNIENDDGYDDVYKSRVLLMFRNEYMKASTVHALLKFLPREPAIIPKYQVKCN